MHSPLLQTIMSLVAVGVISATQAVSLSNFVPRIENLPSGCSNVYRRNIEGCVAQDFEPNKRCSANCVQGLIKISQQVVQQCANVDVPETSIIGVFMLGAGIPSLCPGVEVTTIGKSSTQAPSSQTTQAPAPSTSVAQSSSSSEESASSSSTSTPATLSTATTAPGQSPSPSSSSTLQISIETSSEPLAPGPSSTATTQKSNKDSGGGSPFDVQASGASQLQFAMTTIAGLILLVVALL